MYDFDDDSNGLEEEFKLSIEYSPQQKTRTRTTHADVELDHMGNISFSLTQIKSVVILFKYYIYFANI